MNVIDTLNKALTLFPHQEAIVDNDRRYTYQQCVNRIKELAHGLSELGLSQGDCLSIIAPNCLEFYEVYYAAACLESI